jgi:hypothetical protein
VLFFWVAGPEESVVAAANRLGFIYEASGPAIRTVSQVANAIGDIGRAALRAGVRKAVQADVFVTSTALTVASRVNSTTWGENLRDCAQSVIQATASRSVSGLLLAVRPCTQAALPFTQRP